MNENFLEDYSNTMPIEYPNPSGLISSVLVRIYDLETSTVVVAVETNDNTGPSAINSIESFIGFFKPKLRASDPKTPIRWIVCMANTYQLTPELAEYAEWLGTGWKFVDRENLVETVNDPSLPEFRG